MTQLTLHMLTVSRTWHDWHCQCPSTSTAFVQANCSWNHGRHNMAAMPLNTWLSPPLMTWLPLPLTTSTAFVQAHCWWKHSWHNTRHGQQFFLITSTAWVQANCHWQYNWCNTWHEWHCQWHDWHCHQPPPQLSFSHTDDESTADTTHDMNGTANDDITGTATDHPQSLCEGKHLATGARLTLSLGYSTREMFSARFRSHTAVM